MGKDKKDMEITARYPGVCCACGEKTKRGERVFFHGHGRIECLVCHEETLKAGQNGGDEDESAGFEPGTLSNDRRLSRQGLSVTRFAGGGVVTRNSRGRCEDAPCCGCCS